MISDTIPFEEQGKGPTMILVPGLDGTALLFYRQVPILAQHFRVLTFPLPDDPGCTMSTLVERLRVVIHEALEQNGQQKVLLCGESFGGALSLAFALEHPELLMGLVIVNSFSMIRNRMALRLAPWLLRTIPWGAMKMVRQFTEWKLHSPHTQPEDLAEFHTRMVQVGKKGYIRRLEILQSYDVRDQLSRIQTPTLFLASDRDRLVPSPREAEFMAGRMPNAQRIVLNGYGHICMINHDFNLQDYVLPWLTRTIIRSESH